MTSDDWLTHESRDKVKHRSAQIVGVDVTFTRAVGYSEAITAGLVDKLNEAVRDALYSDEHWPDDVSVQISFRTDDGAATLATMLDAHLGKHRRRDRECIICIVVLAHHESWRQLNDGSDPIMWPLPPLSTDWQAFARDALEYHDGKIDADEFMRRLEDRGTDTRLVRGQLRPVAPGDERDRVIKDDDVMAYDVPRTSTDYPPTPSIDEGRARTARMCRKSASCTKIDGHDGACDD